MFFFKSDFLFKTKKLRKFDDSQNYLLSCFGPDCSECVKLKKLAHFLRILFVLGLIKFTLGRA